MTALSPAERVAWLRLARTEGVGAAAFMSLINRFGGAEAALDALPGLVRENGRSAPLAIPSAVDVEKELAAGADLGAQLILSCEAGFPALLAANEPPPPALWALGDPELLKGPCLAIVGSREASGAGLALARELAATLGQAGWTVVSGMARGVDSAAHEGSIATGSVAVLAGGVDSVYPPQNARLYDTLAAAGCLLSERPLGYEARARDFPRRNRIIAGLSRGVLVVEAELRSGSLITARLAGDLGREVFAAPGHPSDPRARGVNELIRQGATLVETAADVLAVLETLPRLAFNPQSDLAQSPRAISPSPRTSETRRRTVVEALNDTSDATLIDRVESLLSPAPTPFDHLVRATGAALPEVMAALSELHLAGRADLRPGGMAVRP